MNHRDTPPSSHPDGDPVPPDVAGPAASPVDQSAPARQSLRPRRSKRTANSNAPTAVTLETYARQQLVREQSLQAKDHAKLATVEHWESLINVLPPWLAAMPLTAIDARACQTYFAELAALQQGGQLAESTIIVRRNFLSTVLTRARHAGLIGTNPCTDILQQLKQTRGRGGTRHEVTEAQTLTADQIVRVLVVAACDVPPCFYVLVAVMVLTGMVGSEARALQLGDLELDYQCNGVRRPRLWVRRIEHHGTLSRAGWEERSVDVPPLLEAILRDWIARQGLTDPLAWLFPGPLPRATSQRAARIPEGLTTWCMAPETLREAWRKIEARALPGAPRSLTALHHAYCTLSFQLEEDLLYVSLQVGHRSARYTEKAYREWLNPESQGAFATAVERAPVSAHGRPSQTKQGRRPRGGQQAPAHVCERTDTTSLPPRQTRRGRDR